MKVLLLLPLVLGFTTATNWQKKLEPAGKYGSVKKSCKVVPGDKAWPTEQGWNVLNKSVNGNLIKTVPPAAVCHNTFNGMKTYDEAACAVVSEQWKANQTFHTSDPVSPLWSHWYGSTCDPTTDPSTPCTIGKYPHYVVEAKNVKHVQAAVNWARNNNIRLVVKNTGHDFMGKSVGAGSLSVWLHQLRGLEFIDKWSGKKNAYKGPAMKVQPGVHTGEIYAELFKRKRAIVGGECLGVGFGGGYFQGGGHGPLSGLYGMASDNVLEVEIVTADGRFLTANAAENTDIFWAVRGGGGASWGVVTSVTVKTHPETVTAAYVLDITSPENTADQFWAAVTAIHEESIDWVEHGMYIYYELMFNNWITVRPILAPGLTKKQLDKILEPLFKKFKAIGVKYEGKSSEYPTFYESYLEIFQGEPAGDKMLTSGRIVSRQDWKKNVTEITNLMREMNNLPGQRVRWFIGHILQPGNGKGVNTKETAIHPSWKTAITIPLWNIALRGDETEAELKTFINDINAYDDRWKELSPNAGGAYLNEANIFDPDWQKEFYGGSWSRLAKIKEKVDPWGVFYADTAVGAQNWKKSGKWDRLCPSM